MLTAVVTRGTNTQVRLVASSSFDLVSEEGEEEGHEDGAEEGGHSEEDGKAEEGGHSEEIECEFPEENEAGETVCGPGPSPVLPETKELLWGGGSFLVMTVVLAGFLVPKVMKGMKERYDHIEGSKAEAESAKAAAKADVAQYESSLATVKAEARERVDAARQQLEAERAAKLQEVNAAIGAKRDAANAEAVAARHAVEDQVADAVQDVTSRTLELATGKAPNADKVRAAVGDVMQGVSS